MLKQKNKNTSWVIRMQKGNISHEIFSILIRAMGENRGVHTMGDIAELSSIDIMDTKKAIFKLVETGLIKKIVTDKKEENKYELVKELNPSIIALVASLGLNLSEFSDIFVINKKDEEAARALSFKVKELLNDVANKEIVYISKIATNAIYKDVDANALLVLDASNEMLYDYLNTLREKDAYLDMLLTTYEQAESGLAEALSAKM